MNKRIAAITPSITLGITSRAKAMKAEGIDICSFAAGEPDFDTPENIKNAAIKALKAGATKYTPSSGLLELRKAIVDKLKKENGLEYTANQIIVSNGAKHSLYNIIMAICDDGDEVLIPVPYWLSYPEMVNVAGGKSVFVEGVEADDFKVTPEAMEAAITDKTVAVIINSPSNPIGIVYTENELRGLVEVAVKHDLYIIADEIYERMVYDGVKHVSPASLSPAAFAKTITVNGFSKGWSMTGWRLGYFAGPKLVVDAVDALQSHSTSGPNTFAQHGAIEAMINSEASVKKMVAAFAERRSYMYNRLVSIKGITCVKPMGAFYMLPNISSFGMDSVKFAEMLLEKEHLAVVPGAPFGADGNVRVSYACSMANIEKGLDRLEKFVASL